MVDIDTENTQALPTVPPGADDEPTPSTPPFAAVMDCIYARGDRLMAIFLAAHCCVALVLAAFYSTWLVAAAVGIPAVVLFASSAALVPRSLLTRCMAGIALQMFCALHIYQMHGLPEMHFFFFTATTAMIVYQDWRCILPGVFLIIGQHILFAILTNSGESVNFFPEQYVTFTKLVFHFGIALVQAVLCSYWGFLLRRETFRDARQQHELRQGRTSLQEQLSRVRRSESVLQAQARELMQTQDQLRADVEERKRLEAELWQARRMQSVGRLAGGVAHDFNNLLAAILGYSELAQTHMRSDDPASRDIDQIRRAAVRAANLTSQLLAFASRRIIEPRLVDLNSMAQDTAEALTGLLGAGAKVTLRLHPGIEAVRVDPAQFEQIVMNLAANSRDAMPNGGVFTISTREALIPVDGAGDWPDVPAGRYTLMEISDTGEGMSSQVLEHIFDPFFTTKPVGQGTGLGLATCYGIVTQAGGYIRVRSSPGEGTTFTILLPVAQAATESDGALLCAA